jgi:hypothetical protein
MESGGIGPACDVLGDGLASDGHHDAATDLAAAALLSWLGLSFLVPGRLAAGPHRPAVTDVSGNWYLWAVGTQSLAIAAAFVHSGGLLPARRGRLGAGIRRHDRLALHPARSRP